MLRIDNRAVRSTVVSRMMKVSYSALCSVELCLVVRCLVCADCGGCLGIVCVWYASAEAGELAVGVADCA